MAKCDNCHKSLGFLDLKRSFEIKDGVFITVCSNCYEMLLNKREIKLEKVKQLEIKRLNKLEKEKEKLNPKWEYLVTKISTGFGGQLKTKDDELNKLGENGWELVNVALVNQANMFTGQVVTAVMIFKRRLP